MSHKYLFLTSIFLTSCNLSSGVSARASGKVLCELTVQQGRIHYSLKQKDFLKELAIDDKFLSKIGALNNHEKIAPQIQKLNVEGDTKYSFFHEILSYESCEKSEKFISAQFLKTYKYSPKYYSITDTSTTSSISTNL